MGPRTGGIDQIDPTDDMEDTVEAVDDTVATRARIEQTRSDISGTLDAIKEKLQPQTLMQQAKEAVQEVTADVAQKTQETVHHVVEQAKETVHGVVQEARDVVQEAKVAIPEAAHNAMSSAVDTAKDAVGSAVDSAKEAVGDVVHSAKGAGSKVVETFQSNPIPYTLVGVGLGWLYLSMRRHSTEQRHLRERYTNHEYRYLPGQSTADTGPRYESSYEQPGARDSRYQPGYETARSPLSDNLGGLRSQGSPASAYNSVPAADSGRSRVGELAETVQEKATQVAGQVQDTVSEIRSRAADRAGDMAEGFQNKLEESPLVIGAIALGLGAAAGFMLPETRPENRIMGETRDRLVDNVQQTAQDVAQKVQNVAHETLDMAKEAAKEEAKNQGLTA